MRAYGHRRSLVLLTIALVAMAHLPAASGATRAERCAVAKLRAAAKKNAAKLGCHRGALAQGRAVDPACLAAAEARFRDRFGRIEAGGGCATVTDAAALEAAVDACVGTLVSLLPAGPTTTTTATSTTTTTSATATSTTSPICAATSTTITTTTTTMSGGTTTTAPPSATCSNIGGSCGQCGNGQCVAPIQGIPIGACVVPVPLGPCPAGQSDCGPDEVCVNEGGGSLHCYAFCF